MMLIGIFASKMVLKSSAKRKMVLINVIIKKNLQWSVVGHHFYPTRWVPYFFYPPANYAQWKHAHITQIHVTRMLGENWLKSYPITNEYE